MNWLKRLLRGWLEIPPATKTYVTYKYAQGLDGKPVEIPIHDHHWPKAGDR